MFSLKMFPLNRLMFSIREKNDAKVLLIFYTHNILLQKVRKK